MYISNLALLQQQTMKVPQSQPVAFQELEDPPPHMRLHQQEQNKTSRRKQKKLQENTVNDLKKKLDEMYQGSGCLLYECIAKEKAPARCQKV